MVSRTDTLRRARDSVTCKSICDSIRLSSLRRGRIDFSLFQNNSEASDLTFSRV